MVGEVLIVYAGYRNQRGRRVTTMNEFAPNLYEYFGLNPQESSDVLGVTLSERIGQLEQTGLGANSPQQQQIQIAYGVLSNVSHRAIYDETIKVRQVAWHELGHLANFGRFPVQGQASPFQTNPQTPPAQGGVTPPTVGPGNQYAYYQDPQQSQFPHAGAAPQGGAQTYAYGDSSSYGTGGYPTSNVYGAAGSGITQSGERPTAGTRAGMAIVDCIIAAIVAGPVYALGGGTDNTFVAYMLSALVLVSYYIGFEVLLGATPAKFIFGYKVRDVTTGASLSWEQSFKRNWWRVVYIVPVVGWLISFISAIVVFTSIGPASQMQGSQDRLANAEVVRR
mgnify:FL=1